MATGCSCSAAQRMGGTTDGIIDANEKTDGLQQERAQAPAAVADGSDAADKRADLIFGNNFITGSIHGFKFEDIDGRRLWDQANPKGLRAVSPAWAASGSKCEDSNGKVATLANGKLAETKTAGGDDPKTLKVEKKGQFWFTGVMPGNYTLHEILEKSDSNGDMIPDIEQGMVDSTPLSTGPITVGPRRNWVYTPGAAGLTPEADRQGSP